MTQFSPMYRMLERRLTPVATLRPAWEIGVAVGWRDVYEGNLPDEGGEPTYGYAGMTLLIRSYRVFLVSHRIRQGQCPTCGATIDDVEMEGLHAGDP